MAKDQNVTEVSIKKLDRALRQAQASIDPNVPTQMVRAFLTVGLNEGKTLSEIAEILGTNISTASRQLLDLGDRNRKMEPGYELINRQADPMNLRVNRYTLTPKGRHLFKELAAIVEY
jgi:DNA-binding MarR family transcriptional regulator